MEQAWWEAEEGKGLGGPELAESGLVCEVAWLVSIRDTFGRKRA